MEMTPEQAMTQYTSEETMQLLSVQAQRTARLRVQHQMEVDRLTKERDAAMAEVEDLRAQLAEKDSEESV